MQSVRTGRWTACLLALAVLGAIALVGGCGERAAPREGGAAPAPEPSTSASQAQAADADADAGGDAAPEASAPASGTPQGATPEAPAPDGSEEVPPIYLPPPNWCGTNGGGASCGGNLGLGGPEPFVRPTLGGITYLAHPDGRTMRIPTAALTPEKLRELEKEGWVVAWRTSGWSLGARPR